MTGVIVISESQPSVYYEEFNSYEEAIKRFRYLQRELDWTMNQVIIGDKERFLTLRKEFQGF